jgi:hypothetical protein
MSAATQIRFCSAITGTGFIIRASGAQAAAGPTGQEKDIMLLDGLGCQKEMAIVLWPVRQP